MSYGTLHAPHECACVSLFMMDFQSAMETFAEAWVAANAGQQVCCMCTFICNAIMNFQQKLPFKKLIKNNCNSNNNSSTNTQSEWIFYLKVLIIRHHKIFNMQFILLVLNVQNLLKNFKTNWQHVQKFLSAVFRGAALFCFLSF